MDADAQLDRLRARQEVRRRRLSGAAAAAALAGKGRPQSTARLIGMLTHHDAGVREGAVKNLAQIRTADGMAAIARCLKDRDAHVRAAACEALGRLRAHQYKNRLYDAVLDSNAEVRCAAAAALGRMGDKYGLPFVARLLCVRGPHQRAALHALNTITGREFPDNARGLHEALEWIRRQRGRG